MIKKIQSLRKFMRKKSREWGKQISDYDKTHPVTGDRLQNAQINYQYGWYSGYSEGLRVAVEIMSKTGK
jgi:predicted Zn-dependent protease